ncbi:MAG: lipid-A-disaccharide synthase [Candidatus Delongbacteria bacterium]|nr:lipid-A-disaccharide synthase [Candidatus Delongbacteria bacterium]
MPSLREKGGILLVCGESSGDQIAAAMLRELRRRNPRIPVYGVGGPALEKAGMDILIPQNELAVMGVLDVLGSLGTLRRSFRRLEDVVRERSPEMLLLVDFPGFNLRLARDLRSLVPRILYYISPKYWVWKRGRLRTMGELCDAIALIFPFEENDYRSLPVDARFVGHPVLDLVSNAPSRDLARELLGIDSSRPVIAYCPGSRRGELKRHLPILRDTEAELERLWPDKTHAPLRVLQLADGLDPDTLDQATRLLPGVRQIQGQFHTVLRAADRALVASGTASLETAALGTPHMVFYRLDPLAWALASRLVQVKWVTAINIVADRELVPESLQHRATGPALAKWCHDELENPAATENAERLAATVRDLLGGPGAARRTAELALEHIALLHRERGQ